MEHIRLEVDGRIRNAIFRDCGRIRSPIAILLHGSGGSGTWMLRETRWADIDDFFLIAPDATRPDPSKRPGFYSNPPVWNDGSHLPPADRVSTVDDVAFIRQLIDLALQRPTADASRVCVTGFSNGAGMAFRLGLELADRLAAIAPIAGHLSSRKPKPNRPVPTLYMAGTVDPLIPLAGGRVRTPWADDLAKPSINETLSRWAELQGLPKTPAEERVVDGIHRQTWSGDFLEAWFIDGLGHHWPGGRGELNPRIAGPASNRVDATKVIAEFFRSQKIEGRRTLPPPGRAPSNC